MMLCTKCGKEIENGVIFCPYCGGKQDIKQVQASSPEVLSDKSPEVSSAKLEEKIEKKEKSRKNPVLIVFFLIVISLIIIFVAIKLFSKDEDNRAYVNIEFNLNDKDYLWNIEGDYYEVENGLGRNGHTADYVLAFVETEDDTNVLYYTKDDLNVQYVDEDVETFLPSFDGKYIAYIKDVEENEGDLYLYSIEDDKSTEIDSNVYPWDYCVSPNGKYVAYLRDYETDTDNVLYLAGINKDPEKIDKDGAYPVGVLNNGKNMYYVTDNNKLYYYDEEDEKKISTDFGGTVFFNNDLTELLFSEDGDTYYYSSEMDEPEKICKQEFYRVITACDIYGLRGYIAYKNSLKDSVILTEKGLYWFDKAGEEIYRIVSEASYYRISEDEKTLVYVEDGALYKIDKLCEDIEPKCLFDEEYVYAFVSNDDMSRIYAITGTEVYYIKNEKKAELIISDLKESEASIVYTSAIAYCESMEKVFYIEDDTLYCAGTTKKSKEEIAENVQYVFEYHNTVYYYVIDEENEKTVFLIKDGEPMQLFVE